MKKFDAIIIGAGQAGIPLSKKLAKAGWKVALVEKRVFGGTCINDGCSPTKAMIASAKMAYQAGRSEELGVKIESYSVDFPSIIKRKNDVVELFRNGALKGINKLENISLIYGEAKFIADKILEVKQKDGKKEKIEADYIFINTGATPVIPEIPGVKEVDYYTSSTLLDIDEIPEHLLILGAGYIGMEFAQMFRRFGSKVTLFEQSGTLLPKEDDDVCEEITALFKSEQIDLHTHATAIKLKKTAEGKTQVTALINNKEKHFICSHLLLATGRKPQTEFFGIENTGIELDDKGHIKVDDKLETKVKGVFALGDVKGGPAFTQVSYNDHVIITQNLLHHGDMHTKGRIIPYCMFTDPQLGRVGITEKEAIEKNLDFKVAKLPMKHVARAIEMVETKGFMKAIVDNQTKQILGACILGEEGGEIMSVLQMAMLGNITYPQIRYNIFAHPLYSESLNNLFMSFDD